MTTSTLSVLMPNYNHGEFLPGSVQAILDQSCQPIEFIIVDDGSTDNSMDILNKFADLNPVIKLLENDVNKGHVYTFKRALEQVKGDFFFAAAADDLVLPGFFEKSMKMLTQHPEAGVCSTISQLIDEKGVLFGTTHKKPYISNVPCFLTPDGVLQGFLKHDPWFIGNTIIWNSSAIKELKGFPDEASFYVDYFTYPLLALNRGACFIPESLGSYRVMSGSLSAGSRDDPEVLQQTFDQMKDLMSRPAYVDKFPPAFAKEILNNISYRMAVTSLWNFQSARNKCDEYLNYSLNSGSSLNRVFLSGARLAQNLLNSIVRTFLFLRLRPVNLLSFKKLILRLKGRK